MRIHIIRVYTIWHAEVWVPEPSTNSERRHLVTRVLTDAQARELDEKLFTGHGMSRFYEEGNRTDKFLTEDDARRAAQKWIEENT